MFVDPVSLFGMYMKVVGVPKLTDNPTENPELQGKRLGIVNGSSWISLWSSWFGKTILPGVKLINMGNEAVQLSFMRAHETGKPCPPQRNIELFGQYAEQLDELADVHAVLISCSTMNRSAQTVRDVMDRRGVPVIQIDEAMMEQAVSTGGSILVVATHGPTVTSTTDLLKETAKKAGAHLEYTGATVEQAFDLLGQGQIERHNEVVAEAIRDTQKKKQIDVVVLAQLSMSVFAFSYPDPVAAFGVPVLTSGQTGFERVREVLTQLA